VESTEFGRLALGQRIGIDETRVLAQILNTTDPWQVAGRVRLAFPVFLRAAKRLEQRGLVMMAPGSVSLTAKGRRIAKGLGLRSERQIEAAVKRGAKEFASIVERRPTSVGEYDQGYMTTDSVFRRAELMVKLGDSDLRRIAILGDDDLLSIAICLCSEPESVTVFEIDQRVVGFINEIASSLNLPITTECLDLREPLPPRHYGKFHTFATDPSETIAGLKMFIGRGLSLLKSGEAGAGYFGLTTIEASVAKWYRFQKWLLARYAAAITHILPEHAEYQNWPDILAQTSCFSAVCIKHRPRARWFNSALARLETVHGFKPREMGRVRGALFNDDEACGIVGDGSQ
jgi:predicted methyltransferase